MVLGIHKAPESIETGLKAPNVVQLNIKPLNVSAKTILNGIFKGDVMVIAPNAEAQLEVGVSKTFQGAPKLTIQTCKVIQMIKPIINMEKSPVKDILQNNISDLLQSLLCSRVEFIIEERINARFSLLNPKVPLANIKDDVIVNELIDKMRVVRRQR